MNEKVSDENGGKMGVAKSKRQKWKKIDLNSRYRKLTAKTEKMWKLWKVWKVWKSESERQKWIQKNDDRSRGKSERQKWGKYGPQK